MKLMELIAHKPDPRKWLYKEGDIEVLDEQISEAYSDAVDKFLKTTKIKNDLTGREVTLAYVLGDSGYDHSSDYTRKKAEKMLKDFMAKHNAHVFKKVGAPAAKRFQNLPVKVAADLLAKRHRKLADKLTPGLKKVVYEYSADGYEDINRGLRQGNGLSRKMNDYGKHTVEQYAQALDVVFNQPEAVLPHDVVVYRGVSDQVARKLLRGKKFIDKGFVSTSLMPDIADSFGGSYRIKFILPKGSKGLYLNAVTNTLEPQEKEVLLPRAQKYKVLSRVVVPARWGNRVEEITVTLA